MRRYRTPPIIEELIDSSMEFIRSETKKEDDHIKLIVAANEAKKDTSKVATKGKDVKKKDDKKVAKKGKEAEVVK